MNQPHDPHLNDPLSSGSNTSETNLNATLLANKKRLCYELNFPQLPENLIGIPIRISLYWTVMFSVLSFLLAIVESWPELFLNDLSESFLNLLLLVPFWVVTSVAVGVIGLIALVGPVLVLSLVLRILKIQTTPPIYGTLFGGCFGILFSFLLLSKREQDLSFQIYLFEVVTLTFGFVVAGTLAGWRAGIKIITAQLKQYWPDQVNNSKAPDFYASYIPLEIRVHHRFRFSLKAVFGSFIMLSLLMPLLKFYEFPFIDFCLRAILGVTLFVCAVLFFYRKHLQEGTLFSFWIPQTSTPPAVDAFEFERLGLKQIHPQTEQTGES